MFKSRTSIILEVLGSNKYVNLLAKLYLNQRNGHEQFFRITNILPPQSLETLLAEEYFNLLSTNNIKIVEHIVLLVKIL